MELAEPKVYAKKQVKIDIDGDGEEEEAVAFLLSGSFVLKLRKAPPESHIQAWRKLHIKPGVTANIAVLKPQYKGKRGGRTILTSIWYDLDHLAEVDVDTRRLIYELLRQVPEDELTDEQKRAISKMKRMKFGGENVWLTVKLSEKTKDFWHNILPFGEFYYRGEKLKITREMCENMVKNFKAGIPHYKLPVNISHNDMLGKYGNIVDLEVRDDGLWAHIVLTEEGTKLLESEKFEYLSAEFDMNYEDKRTNKKVGPTLLGVALTNRPAHPDMKPIRLEEEVIESVLELESELEDELEEAMTLALTKEDKEEFLRRIRREGTPQLLEAHKWLHAYAASGRIPEGATKQDLIWMHNAIVKELNRRKKEKGQKVEKHPTPLKFEVEEPVEVELNDDDEVFKLCLGPTFAKLRASARKKKKKKLEEVNGVEERAVVLEETVRQLQEELKVKEEEVKKLSEENEALKKELTELKVEAWARGWIEKGVPPAVVETAKKKVLEEQVDMVVFDEVFENVPKAEKKQLSEEAGEKKISAAEVAKAIWGGDADA